MFTVDVKHRIKQTNKPLAENMMICLSDLRRFNLSFLFKGARWPNGRVSDSGAKGREFDSYLRRVVSLSKDTLLPEKYW